ncbi:MAG TPA: EEP domain-containing protein, partial [Bdellovibrionota bacterium]
MKTWRLITYNIHKGLHPFRNLDVIERVKLSLRESRADFLLLQEVVGERRHSRTQVENQLMRLADKRWRHHAYGKNA